MLKKMHNWKDLCKKNTSANLTFRNWVERDNKNILNTELTSGPTLSEIKAQKILNGENI